MAYSLLTSELSAAPSSSASCSCASVCHSSSSSSSAPCSSSPLATTSPRPSAEAEAQAQLREVRRQRRKSPDAPPPLHPRRPLLLEQKKKPTLILLCIFVLVALTTIVQPVAASSYACDVAVRTCMINGKHPNCRSGSYDAAIPQTTSCAAWKCVVGCARQERSSGRSDCLEPWTEVCEEIARKPSPIGSGSTCDVDCSSSVPIAGPARSLVLGALALTVAASLLLSR